MAYSFTEKKRIRKDFGKRDSILEVPYLLAIQLDSYRKFLQADTTEESSQRSRSARRFQERVSDHQLFWQRDSRIRELSARRSGVRRQGVPDARPHVRSAAARQGAPGRVRQGNLDPDQEDGEGHPRAGGLPGRTAADDRQRHLRRQRHRTRHRVAAASSAPACSSITTAARRTARASCCSPRALFLTAARGSISSSTRRTACSPVSTAAASCRSPSSCVLSGYTEEQMLDMFFDKTTYHLSQEQDRTGPDSRAPARRDSVVRPSRSAMKSSSKKAAA